MNKILIADDDRDMCNIISTILKEGGYKVAKVYDGIRVIKKVKEESYDLIILDYKIPFVDGIEVMQTIRSLRLPLKVIMISAYGSDTIKSEANKLGVYRFLDKPFDMNRLLTLIENIFRKKEGRPLPHYK